MKGTIHKKKEDKENVSYYNNRDIKVNITYMKPPLIRHPIFIYEFKVEKETESISIPELSLLISMSVHASMRRCWMGNRLCGLQRSIGDIRCSQSKFWRSITTQIIMR
jgi:hypothetical protein